MRETRCLPAWARGYERGWVRGDVLAGLTVAAYLIPQTMAYAQVAGLPPATGLWAAITAMSVYALLGSSSQLSVGPEATTALMTAAALAPFAAGDPDEYAALAAVLALLVGAICLGARLVRMGFLADLLSKPVLVGYLAGVAVIMMVGQLGKVTRIAVEGDAVGPQLRSFVERVDAVHTPTLALGLAVLAFLVGAHHWWPQAPVPLFGVLLAVAAAHLLNLGDRGVAVVGSVAIAPPHLGVPDTSWARVGELVLAAVGIAVVGYSDNVLTARAFAARRHEPVGGNRELLALGAANLAAGAVGGFPVSGSGSRTVIGDALGSRTQLHSLVAAGAVLVSLASLRPLLEDFPLAALGALVIYAAVRLVEVGEIKRLARFRRAELGIAVATTAGVLVIGVLPGIGLAVGLSVLDLFRRVARPHDAILGTVPGLAGMHDVDDFPDAAVVPGLLIYRYDSPLFFANSADFVHRARAAVANSADPVRWFVLNAEAIPEIDMTAADALEELRSELTATGVIFALSHVKRELRANLVAVGFLDRVMGRVYPTLPTAVAAYTAWCDGSPAP